LPAAFQFFAGKRFVLIVSFFGGIALGIIMTIIWPPVQSLLGDISSAVSANQQNVGLAAFLFGLIERLLIPFGLQP